MSATQERLSHLVETSDEWSEELEIDPPSGASIDRALAIISLLPSQVADDYLRVFPSENAGISLQTMLRGLRVLEIGEDQLLGIWVDDANKANRYNIASNSAAISFLMGR